MALQTSGTISLNQIHYEAGGGIGTTASLNDSDIRALIGKGSGVQMSFSEWYGASNLKDTQIMTVGQGVANPYYGVRWGYGLVSQNIYSSIGSISDGTSNIYSGATVGGMYWHDLNGSYKPTIFSVAGNKSNSGWTSMYIYSFTGAPYPSTTLARSSASYSYNASKNATTWSWGGVTSNPFGTTSGATKKITWS